MMLRKWLFSTFCTSEGMCKILILARSNKRKSCLCRELVSVPVKITSDTRSEAGGFPYRPRSWANRSLSLRPGKNGCPLLMVAEWTWGPPCLLLKSQPSELWLRNQLWNHEKNLSFKSQLANISDNLTLTSGSFHRSS